MSKKKKKNTQAFIDILHRLKNVTPNKKLGNMVIYLQCCKSVC